jgi:hypothetical protein
MAMFANDGPLMETIAKIETIHTNVFGLLAANERDFTIWTSLCAHLDLATFVLQICITDDHYNIEKKKH